jgi:hypothetical protein
MSPSSVQLYDLVNPKDSDKILTELLEIAELCKFKDKAVKAITETHNDIVNLFNGKYKGYRASNAKYHNLEHTCSVVMSTARLLHGCIVNKFAVINETNFTLGIISAYFHDTGMIQEEGDTVGTGAKYTIGHEQRSINFMTKYMLSKGYSDTDIRLCSEAIQSTKLNTPPSKIKFSNMYSEMIGRIVGSADLIAQIADRTYLEKLNLLFAEFHEARLPGFNTELDLLKQTEDFYTKTARKRLNEDFGGIHRHLKAHFNHKWNIDKDLYTQAIEANVSYIRNLVDICKDDYDCYMENLRRALD